MENKTKNNDYLSKQYTNAVKGILSICIVVHHLYIWTSILRYPIVSIIFSGPLGYWSVSLFFFFSGYGIWNSILKKGCQYIKSFPRNRLLPFFCVNTVLIILYSIIYAFLSDYETLSFRLIAQSFLWGDTIIKNGWYLQVQMLLYVVFFVMSSSFLKRGNKIKLFLVCFTVSEILYSAICLFLKMDAYWYQTVLSFDLGILWCQNKSKIDEWIRCHKVKSFLISFFGFIISFVIYLFLMRSSFVMITTFVNIISTQFFDITVVLLMNLSLKCRVYDSKLLRALGRYSFGTYVLHGAWMCILRGTKIYIENDYLYVALVLVLVAISTVMFTPLYEKIFNVFKSKKSICDKT